MSIQSSPVPTVTLPSITLKDLLDSNSRLKEEVKIKEQEKIVRDLAFNVLEVENTTLKDENNTLKVEKNKKDLFVQLVDEDLQSSKRVLQYVCAIAGALLGGGLILTFPPAGVPIALGGRTGSMAAAALTGGVTGGYLVAPVLHEKTHKAVIQQIHTFKTKEEAFKKTESSKNLNQ
ncbi:MAG: hypothetical protein LBC45_03310 [Chlamydiales bacterium]|jgi:hypothetical protein|nr:hypothetical protein [Chlamydiales bacterium]